MNVPDSNTDAERFEVVAIRAKLGTLQEALLTKDPMMAQHLKEIHKALMEQEDLVHMLTPQDRAVVIASLKAYRGAKLVEKATSKPRSRKTITVDDV